MTVGLPYLFKSALMFAAIVFFATRGARAGHPFDCFGAANYLTTFRAAIVSLVAALVGETPTPAIATGAALASVVAAALDGVDGLIARRTGLTSEFGARFDMEVDALLVLVLSVLTWQHGKAGVWIVSAGLMRYGFVAAGWVWPRLTRPLFPSMRRQTICVVLVIGLSVLLLPQFTPPVSTCIAAALLALICTPSSRTRLGCGGTLTKRLLTAAAALWLLNASLTFRNWWPTPFVKWHGELSIELGLLLLVLAALPALPTRRRWIGGLAALWLVLILGRYIDVTAPALWGRDLNLYWDLRFLPDVAAMLAGAGRWWLGPLVALLATLMVAVFFLISRAAIGALDRAASGGSGRRALAGLGAVLVILFAGDRLDVLHPPAVAFARPAVAVYGEQAVLIARGLSRSRVLPPSPSFDADLSAICDADVLLFFIESYGAVAFEHPGFAAPLAAHRQQLEDAIRDSGHQVVSAFVESPTFGGSSWFAHVTLLSGIKVGDPDTNALLLEHRRETLPSTFARHGYRTVAVMPGMWSRWLEGAFYGFSDTYTAPQLEYKGPPFGWWDLTDQFAYARLDETEIGKGDRQPLFVFLPTVSTHTPFTPTPPYQPDWSRMTGTAPYDLADLDRVYGEEVDWDNLGAGYVRAMSYSYETLAGYFRRHSGADFVVILIGDHQPPAIVTGEGASWDVPVHIVTSRPAILARLRAAGFTDGIAPARPSLGPMNALTPLLLRAFGNYQ